MSQADVDKLMNLWAASFLQARSDASPPFDDHKHMHDTIDSIKHGDAPWHSIKIKYNGIIPEENAPKWMTDTFEICLRDVNLVVANLLKNTDFDGEFDYVCYEEYDANGVRRYQNFFSGKFAGKQSVSVLKKTDSRFGV